MADEYGGVMTLPRNGSSPVDLRERFLKIDPPPFEVDPLAARAQARMRSDLVQPRPTQADPDTSDEIALAREKANRLDRAVEAAETASRATGDGLEALQAGRSKAEDTRVALERAAKELEQAVEKQDIGAVRAFTLAVRDAASAAEDARSAVTRALDEVEQADLDELSRALRQPVSKLTRLEGSVRDLAVAIDARLAVVTDDRSLAFFAGPISRSSVGRRLERAASAAQSALALTSTAVDAFTDANRHNAEEAAVARQRAREAWEAVNDLEDEGPASDVEPPPAGGFTSPADELLRFVGQKGIRSSLLSLTQLLNRNSLSDVQRLLLSTTGAYERTLLTLLKDQGSPAADTKGLRLAVVGEVAQEIRTTFVDLLLDEYRQSRALKLEPGQLARIRERILGGDDDRFLRLGIGRTAKALDTLVDEELREGKLPDYVSQFADRGDLDSSRFTEDVRSAMVDYLENLGLVELNDNRFRNGAYDEYFVQAYNFALFGDGRRRPTSLRVIRPADSDFTMNVFALADEQGVVREHILAAAALYQMYVLGDQLGIYALPSALMLRRARGRLDLSRGTGSQVLQEYKRYLRTAPLLPEDRQLLYRRVFNEGNGQVLDDAIANEEFPTLWDSLMREIGDYIHKTEENSSDLEDKISRSPVDEAVRNLQYNLSFFATDVAEDVRDMKEQYELALDVLQDPDIISSVVSGPRQNMWTVIERVLADDMKRAPNVSALRRLGVEGYKILRYTADFQGPVSDDDFKSLIRSGEIWIIARGSIGPVRDAEEPEDEEAEDEFAADDDDWES